MEHESKLSDIIASLPEISGGFLYAPDKGIYSNPTVGISTDDSLQQIGMKLTKIVSMVATQFSDTNAIRVNFKDLILFGTAIHNSHWMFLLHQPSLSPGMLRMTVQMALNIEPETIQQDQITEIPQTPDPNAQLTAASTENIMGSLLAPESELERPLTTMQEQLAHYIGPVAGLIFQDSVETWAANNTPSLDNLPALISILEEEIDEEDDRTAFRDCINSHAKE